MVIISNLNYLNCFKRYPLYSSFILIYYIYY